MIRKLLFRRGKDEAMPSIEFWVTSKTLKLRDKFGIPFRPEAELNKLNIQEGQTVLDYGCGVGSFSIPTARLVGEKGKVYALDKQPLAVNGKSRANVSASSVAPMLGLTELLGLTLTWQRVRGVFSPIHSLSAR